MDRLLEIAPLATWIRVPSAALLILLGIVAFSHFLVLRHGYGLRFDGPFSASRPASLLRWAAILCTAGLLLWGLGLAWPTPVLAVLALIDLAFLAGEIFARLRNSSRPPRPQGFRTPGDPMDDAHTPHRPDPAHDVHDLAHDAHAPAHDPHDPAHDAHDPHDPHDPAHGAGDANPRESRKEAADVRALDAAPGIGGAHGSMHRHGRGPGHGAHTPHAASTECAPPEEPGYPDHPELAHPHRHPLHDETEHDRHTGHTIEQFRDRFWICALLTLPILAYSEQIQEWLGFTAPAFPGSAYIPFVFGSVIFFYGGLVFLRGAIPELRGRRPGMMTLISLAITVAYLYSVAGVLRLVTGELWWELATLVDVMLLGHWIEMRSVGRASGALRELAKLLPDTAERVTDGGTETVRADALREGDVVLVRPGGAVPADGVVVRGRSSVNEAMITGESRPVEKNQGDDVIAGTVNGEGSLRVRVTKTGEATALAGIMRLVEEAQASRSRAQDLADRAAFVLTLVAIGAGTLTLVAWLALGQRLEFALERTVTVMVIACPHALGLAIPLVIAISTTLAARGGLLVRRRDAFERSRALDVVVFDKTGTLTEGRFGVTGIVAGEGLRDDEVLRLAAAAEADSEHVMARAIVDEAERRGIGIPQAEAFEAIPGRGVRARVEGREVRIGRPALVAELEVPADPELERAAKEAAHEGRSVVHVVINGRHAAIFALADRIRPESYDAVRRLEDQGVRVAMLTGDGEDVARAVATELGIDEFFARVLPEDKSRRIEELRRRGLRVAMVGDGVNDAPALLAADVGIAIGAGTNVAIEAGDIVLVRNDPRDIARIVALSRASYRKMRQNLAWATGYNVVAIPLAAGVLAGRGIVLAPAVGAILMSVSTIIVAVNAQLLWRRR
ncbi:MAG TPA: heavy metal translocating P-type ATPase [Longimicrobiales bacterium]